MTRHDFLGILIANQKGFVFFFSVLFGVVAQECYHMIRNEHTTIKKAIPKAIIAFFVCFIAGGFLSETDMIKKYYPHAMMLLAFLHRPASEWIMKDFLPYLGKQIIKKGDSNNAG